MNKESLEKRLKDLNDSLAEQQGNLQKITQQVFLLEGAKLECMNNIKLLEQESKEEEKVD